MKKLIVSPLIFLIVLSMVTAIQLIDYEDFENYTANNGTTMLNDSLKWNCTNSNYNEDSCVQHYVGGNPLSNGSFWIDTNGTNQFLRFWIEDSTGTPSRDEFGLHWDFNDVGDYNTPYTNISIFFDLFVGTPDNTQGFGSDIKRIEWQPTLTLLDTTWYAWNDTGTPYSTIEADSLPFPFRCNTTIDQWNNIGYVIEPYGVGLVARYLYVDGVQCISDSSSPFNTGYLPLTEFDIIMTQSLNIYLDDIYIYNGTVSYAEHLNFTAVPDANVTCTTNCSTWTNPYLLIENFNGYLNGTCDWSVTENICFSGQLDRDQTDVYYSAFKLSDELTDDVNRYFTVAFDIKPTDIASNGWVAVSLYDSELQRFIQFLIGDNGTFYNNDNGNSELVYANVSTTTSKTVNLHVDFSSDDYDLWYDGSKVASDLGFSDAFLNIESFSGIRISSDNSEYEIDTLEIYATDQDNQIIIVDDDLPVTADPTVAMCGLFYRDEIECSVDSDCPTGQCLPNGKCNSFDMTYCDDNGHTRGNKCMISAITSCTLESTADIILDNFLLFLVFLVLLVIIVYIIYALK